MFMTGVLCTVCGARVYFKLNVLDVVESFLMELESSLIQLQSAANELVRSLIVHNIDGSLNWRAL